jgi:hypothetical protein
MRKAILAAVGKRAEGWIALINGIIGKGGRWCARPGPGA